MKPYKKKEMNDKVKELKSYKTIVCKIGNNGNFIRIWDGWSQTTLRHVNEFRQQNG